MKKKRGGVIVTPKVVSAVGSTIGPTVWISDNFAEDWFSDAVAETRGKDHNSRRREIIFASCFLESYIFEWTRGIIPIQEINNYFPVEPRGKVNKGYLRTLLHKCKEIMRPRSKANKRFRRTLKEKWKYIPRELYEHNRIPVNPDLDLSDLGVLMKYRHGLIHAASSRPATDKQPEKTKPFPTKEDLKVLKPGWAVGIAADLVKQLHKKLGSTSPKYIK
jgi:hypothetical protein